MNTGKATKRESMKINGAKGNDEINGNVWNR